MKSAREKVVEWMKEQDYWYSEEYEITESLIILLKEQDRDTRHACAEAVMAEAVSDGYDRHGVLISTDQACSTIMNTKAV